MKVFLRTLLLTLLAVTLTVPAACSKKREYPAAPAYRPLPNGEFPIVASYAFYPPYINDRQFEWVKEAGFNVIRKFLSPSETDSVLKYASRHGLYVTVAPWNIRDAANAPGIVRRYKGNPTVWGYSVADEPRASAFGKLAEVMAALDTLDPANNGFINLLPTLGNKTLEADDYEDYVTRFVEEVNPPFLSVDHYPVVTDKQGRPYVHEPFYETMETISKVARESGRPFWSYIQSEKHGWYPAPSLPFLRFQVFSALGYGAQGLSYFTYLAPDFDKGKGEFTLSPIDAEGRRTPTWYMVRQVNSEVQALSDVFLGAEVVSVGHTGNRPDATSKVKNLPAPFRKIDSKGVGVMVSHLRNGGSDYVLVVNRDINAPQQVDIRLEGKPVTRIDGSGATSAFGGGKVEIEPGSYLLFKIS